MSFTEAVRHLFFFAAPAILLGFLSSLCAKLIWHAQLKRFAWFRLGIQAAAASLIGCGVGMVLLGRDGKMLTYLAMVTACAASLWWSTRRIS